MVVPARKHYVLIDQSSRTVDVFTRLAAVWVVETVTAGQLRLDSIDVVVTLDDLYDQVTFAEQPSACVAASFLLR